MIGWIATAIALKIGISAIAYNYWINRDDEDYFD